MQEVLREAFLRERSSQAIAGVLLEIQAKRRCSKACKIRTTAIKKCHVADTGTIEKWIKELVAKIKLVSHDSDVDDANLMKELNKLSRE